MPRVSRPLRPLLSLGIVLGLGATSTHAYWIDSAEVTGTTITAGTVDLKVENADAVSTFTAMNGSGLMAGETTAGVLTVRNAGTAPLVYYVDATVTNTDGKNLGSVLDVKVTDNSSTTGSSGAVTCANAALTGTGTKFTSSLVGSATAPRTLAAGATESLCIQARVPSTTVADGAVTDVAFTFRASSAGGSWPDTVQVTGTTIKLAHALYLKTNSTGNTSSSLVLPLGYTVPTLTTLYNYDTNNDSSPGRMLAKTSGIESSDASKMQRYSYSVPSATTLSGAASIRLWSAMKEFERTKTGAMQVGLFDCDSAGSTCTRLARATLNPTGSWSGGSTTWVVKTWDLGSISHTFAANRVIQVRVAALDAAEDDMWIAYDTTSYPSVLTIR